MVLAYLYAWRTISRHSHLVIVGTISGYRCYWIIVGVSVDPLVDYQSGYQWLAHRCSYPWWLTPVGYRWLSVEGLIIVLII